MFSRLTRLVLVATLPVACGQDSSRQPASQVAQAGLVLDTVWIQLSDSATLSKIYSYPNNDTTSKPISLDSTIARYANQTLQRDLITNARATVRRQGDTYRLGIAGPSAAIAPYGRMMRQFLDNGLTAYSADSAWNLTPSGKSVCKTMNGCPRIFLPLGLAMINMRSVQLLHFPPDYTLTRDQDYLNSKTSRRWESLLAEHGIAGDSVTLFETIVDIDPIAAVDNAGGSLPYPPKDPRFVPYAQGVLTLLYSADTNPTIAPPLVAYGAPVRDWVKAVYGLQLSVNSAADSVRVDGRRRTPMLAANHPSYIWGAVKNSLEKGDTAAAVRIGTPIMKQDLASACWQARLGTDRTLDASTTARDCVSRWTADSAQTRVCQLVWIQVLDVPPDSANVRCGSTGGRRRN